MESSTSQNEGGPFCSCGAGSMKLLCSGKKTKHAGRFFYKCPLYLDHAKGFHWADDYHRKYAPETTPTCVLNQTWKEGHASSSYGDVGADNVLVGGARDPTRPDFKLAVMICFNFMAIVIFLLGVVFGKLIGV